jgi:light-harvesting complex 1 beta chain
MTSSEAAMTTAHAHSTTETTVERLEGFHVIFIVTFAVFLILALLGQLLHWDWRTLLPGAEGARSVWHGVRASVYTVISQLS